MSHSFIRLWVGEEYTLSQSPFILLIIYTIIIGTRVNDLFLSAYGMYQDVWAPIAEAVINIGGSILLGYYWGLTGIIAGIVISLFLIVFCWKPYFLFRFGFKDSIGEYIIRIFKYLMLMAIAFIVSSIFTEKIENIYIESYLDWISETIKYLSLYSILISLLFLIFDSGFRGFANRMILLLKLKR